MTCGPIIFFCSIPCFFLKKNKHTFFWPHLLNYFKRNNFRKSSPTTKSYPFIACFYFRSKGRAPFNISSHENNICASLLSCHILMGISNLDKSRRKANLLKDSKLRSGAPSASTCCKYLAVIKCLHQLQLHTLQFT